MSQAPLYPLFLNLSDQPVLIVGGGLVALRKAKGLLECGARVTVVSPAFADDFAALPLRRLRLPYATPHMARARWRLVFAATNVATVNAQVRRDAADAGIFCSRADAPDESDFAGGAHIRIRATPHGQPVATLAVSTSGASPVLASRLCKEAAAGIDPVLITLGGLLTRWRADAKRSVKDAGARRALLQRVAGEEMESILRKRGTGGAQKFFRQWLAEARASTASPRRTRGTS